MRHVVLACVEAGLVSADVLAVDGTLVKARAATKSLEAIPTPICLEEYLARVRKQDEANHDGDEPPGDNPPAATGSASRKHRKAGDPDSPYDDVPRCNTSARRPIRTLGCTPRDRTRKRNFATWFTT